MQAFLVFIAVVFALLGATPVAAQNPDGGNVVAGILGTVLGIFFLCVLIGYFARKQGASSS